MKLALFDRLEEGVIALLLAVMTMITFTQVIARYVFNYSFVWALETNTFLFGGLIFFGMAYGVRVGTHIGVDALVKTMSRRSARLVLPIGFGLLVVRYSALLYRIVAGKESGLHLADEAADALKLRQEVQSGDEPPGDRK
jgi:C4-dicarboxylate transporter DctQ subunit